MANRQNQSGNRDENLSNESEQGKGQMTVQEAGRKGGHIGGEHTRDKYGPEFYSEIGQKGGQRVRELVEEGKQAEGSTDRSNK